MLLSCVLFSNANLTILTNDPLDSPLNLYFRSIVKIKILFQ